MVDMGMKPPFIAALLTFLILSSPLCLGGIRINTLILGHPGNIRGLSRIFDYEPLVTYESVIIRSGFFDKLEDNMKLIRLYFPRNYEKMKTFDLLVFTATEYGLFTVKQDKWMFDVIREGAGGINDGSLFSIISPTSTVWANSQCARAFPNDAPLVDSLGWRSASPYRIEINRDHPEPILTPFIEFDVEGEILGGAMGMVIAREGAQVLAWQIGNYPNRADLLANWEYENGRTITAGMGSASRAERRRTSTRWRSS
jgi:hypothetical protein